MSKMTVIQLLNKIANGEIKLETKFNWHYKLYDIELIFTERQGALWLYFQKEDRLIGLFERFNYQILNDEVEIIEEEKKIPEKIGNDYYHKTQPEQNQIFQRKINEIIDYLKSKGE